MHTCIVTGPQRGASSDIPLAGRGAERLDRQTMDMTDLEHLDLIAAEVLPHLS